MPISWYNEENAHFGTPRDFSFGFPPDLDSLTLEPLRGHGLGLSDGHHNRLPVLGWSSVDSSYMRGCHMFFLSVFLFLILRRMGKKKD